MTMLKNTWCHLSLAVFGLLVSTASAGAQGYRELAAVPWQATGVDLFAIDSDDSIEHRFQREADGDFAQFEELGGVASDDIAALELADGRYEVYIVDRDQKLWRNWQPPGDFAWSGWEVIDESTKKVAVARADSGRVELFVIGSDDALWHRGRNSDEEELGEWTRLDVTGTQLAAAAADADGFELALIDSDRVLWQLSFSADAELIGEPRSHGGESFDVALARLPGGGHSLVAVGTDNSLWELRRSNAEDSFSDWQGLAGTATRVTLVETASGPALFTLSAGDQVQKTQLTAADAVWTWSEAQTLVEASTLDSELEGSARLIIPSLDTDQDVPVTIGLRFSVDRTRVAITSFPEVVTDRFDTPFGATTSTVALTGTSLGELRLDEGVVRLPISLHFDQSLDLPIIEEDGSLDLTLSSDHPDGQLFDRATGEVTLSAAGSFQGDGATNPLDGQDCQVIVSGTITPAP